MKTTSVVAVVASLGSASAFVPSGFMGASVATKATSANGVSMSFGRMPGKSAAPAPAKKAAAPVKKAAAPVKKAAAPVKKAAAPVKKAVAPAVKKVAAPVKKAVAPAVKKVAAPIKKAVPAAVKKVSAPSGGAATASFFGSDVEAGFWDPLDLAAGKSQETIDWYRAAELKHGRIAMAAVLGTWVTSAGISLPDPAFQAFPKSFDVLSHVASERPGALLQILTAIAAIEVLSLQLPEGAFPGDLLWDPAGQIPVYEKQGKFDELRLKELKNGRLAMLAIAGEWAQEALTGQGVFEQLSAGHVNPFGDGQGAF